MPISCLCEKCQATVKSLLAWLSAIPKSVINYLKTVFEQWFVGLGVYENVFAGCDYQAANRINSKIWRKLFFKNELSPIQQVEFNFQTITFSKTSCRQVRNSWLTASLACFRLFHFATTICGMRKMIRPLRGTQPRDLSKGRVCTTTPIEIRRVHFVLRSKRL